MSKSYVEVRDSLIPQEVQAENDTWAKQAIAWETFCQAITGNVRHKTRQLAAQRLILDFYLRSPEGATASECFKSLGGGFSDAREVGCHITGIRKRAQASGLNPDDVLTRSPDKRFHPGAILKANENVLKLRSVMDDLAIVYRKNPPKMPFAPNIDAEPAFRPLAKTEA